MSIAKSKAEIQREYERRTGYAAQKKYDAKVVKATIRLNPDTDADILSELDMEKPFATQVKALMRKGIKK